MEVRPGYKLTEVGVIPEDWEVRKLLSAVSIATGQVDPRIEPYRSMILVAPDHIEGSTGRLLATRTAVDQRAVSGKYKFESGDVIYSKIRPYLRKAVIADFSGLCSADMYPLRPADDASSGFILAVLLGHRFSKYAESVSARSGMPKINRVELADYSLAMPSLWEQRAISGALGDVDALLGALERLIAKKRDLKQAAMQQLLTGQTRLPRFTGDWEVDELGECLTERPRYGINAPACAYSDDLPVYIRITDITEDGLFSNESRVSVRSEMSSNYLLSDGDIVFARTGASVGKSFRYTADVGPLVFAGFLVRVRPNTSKLIPAFASAYVTTESYWSWVRLMSMRSGQPGINGTEYSQMPILLPSTTEQTAIAAVLTDMDTELAALDQRLAKTRALKQAMMQELLTGRTRLVAPGVSHG